MLRQPGRSEIVRVSEHRVQIAEAPPESTE
jgi:hypothetical protein